MGAAAGGRGVDPAEALRLSLKNRRGIDWDYMAQVSGRPRPDLAQYLLSSGAAFPDPGSGQWQTRDEYLAGNVRQKLTEAKAAARTSPLYRANVDALQKVQPPQLGPSEISAQLGASWIKAGDIQDFAKSIGLGVRVTYVRALARWTVRPTSSWKAKRWRSKANTREWGTRQVDAVRLLEMALNGTEPKVKDRRGNPDVDETFAARDKLRKIEDEFKGWLWSDKKRTARLVQYYNDNFNNTVRRQYTDAKDMAHPPGLNPKYQLRENQKRGIFRILDARSNVLLAHEVGFGKTIQSIVASREMRRLRLGPKKFVHCVPNHRLTQHADDFRDAYADAKLMLISADDLSPRNYQETMRKIAEAEDYDAIIMSHSALEKIPSSKKTQRAILQKEIDEYDRVLKSLPARATRKRKMIVAVKNRMEKRLEKVGDQPDAKMVWEDLEVDGLVTDESHRWKSLGFATKWTNLSGVNPAGSKRAMGMYMKTSHLNDTYGEGNIVFMTATPLSNSVAEIYTYQRMLQPRRLKELGLEHFDNWAKQFGKKTTALEISPTGSGYREATRFSSFSNIPELSTLFGEVADVENDAGKLNLPLPKLRDGGPITLSVPMSDNQKAYMKELEQRIARVRARQVSPDEDNFLKICGDAYKSTLDFRLIDPAAPDDPNSKVNQAAKTMLAEYKRTTGVTLPGVEGKQNLSQVAFLDISTPKPGKFSLYKDMKQKLIRGGVPADEIAFIHDAKNAGEKQRIFDQVNLGKIRFLFASTQMAGEGSNFQSRLAAAHMIDQRWTSHADKQRSGRIMRPGNLVPEIAIFRYVTSGSSDAYRYQTVERKALASDQLLSGDVTSRTIDDIGDIHADYATTKAIAAGDPIVKSRVQVQLKIQELQSLARVHQKRQRETREKLDKAQGRLAFLKENEPDNSSISELNAQIRECQAELVIPFERETELRQLRTDLAEIDKEISDMNRPPPKPAGVARQLLGTIFGRGGRS